MAATDITRGTVWAGTSATCLARIRLNGVTTVWTGAGEITAVTRFLYDLDSATPTVPVDETDLTIDALNSVTIMLGLQTDSRWNEDITGYNFRDTIPSALLSAAHRYYVEYLCTGPSGEQFIIPFELAAQEAYST